MKRLTSTGLILLGLTALAACDSRPPQPPASAPEAQLTYQQYRQKVYAKNCLNPATKKPNFALAGEVNILALGSSTTFGTGASRPEETYTAKFANIVKATCPAANLSLYVKGYGGASSTNLRNTYERELTSLNAQSVLLQVGAGDFTQGLSLTDYEQSLRGFVDLLLSQGKGIVLIGPQFTSDRDFGSFNEVTAKVAADNGLPFANRYGYMLDLVKYGQPLSELVSQDGLHHTDAGYTLLAECVAGAALGIPNPMTTP